VHIFVEWLNLSSWCQCGKPFSILNESIALYPALTKPCGQKIPFWNYMILALSYCFLNLTFGSPACMIALYTGTHDSFGMWSSQPISPTKLTLRAKTLCPATWILLLVENGNAVSDKSSSVRGWRISLDSGPCKESIPMDLDSSRKDTSNPLSWKAVKLDQLIHIFCRGKNSKLPQAFKNPQSRTQYQDEIPIQFSVARRLGFWKRNDFHLTSSMVSTILKLEKRLQIFFVKLFS